MICEQCWAAAYDPRSDKSQYELYLEKLEEIDTGRSLHALDHRDTPPTK